MDKKFYYNKRGDIPIIVLVIGVFALCGLAIISFILSEQASDRDILLVSFIESVNSDVEEFYFYLNAGLSEEEAAREINAEILENRLIIERNWIVSESDGFFRRKDKEKIKIKYVVNLSE